MKILKNIILGLVILIALLAVIGLIALPRESKVERTIVIQAPAEVIFDQVNDLKKADVWSPWKDSTMKITFGPVTAGQGASNSWESKDMGKGTQTIEESNPSSSIKIHLDFGSMGTAKALWNFAPEGEGVKVTEAMLSDAGMNPAKRWMSLMSDKMVGPYFEKGLASLKQVSEARASELKIEAEAAAAAAAAAAQAAADSAAAADSLAAAAKSVAKGKKHK